MNSDLFMHICGVILFLMVVPLCTSAEKFDEFRSKNSDLAEFLKLLKTNPYLDSALGWKSGTLIAPTDQAIRDYTKIYKLPFTNNILLYHYANVPRELSELEMEDSITSDLSANPPIWITKKNNGLFLNDAKILRGNLRLTMENGMETLVHVIDRVLTPTIPTTRDSHLDSPTARIFLENSAKYGLNEHQLTTKFANQVSKTIKNDKTGLLDSIGKRTYFIPVDDAFKKNNNIKSIDSRTIDGHVIPDRVIFLRTADIGQRVETYKTTDMASNFPVFITFATEIIDGKEVWIVKSDNRDGDKDHAKGVVQAQIVKANIPVRNGVVHLISKPLVLIDTSVYHTLKLYAAEQIGGMKEFYNLLETQSMEYGFRKILEGTNANANKITLFVPSNNAIRKSTELGSLLQNRTAIADLIKLHILIEPVSKENIIENNKSVGKPSQPYQVTSLLSGRKLYFNVIGGEGNRTLFVEGGGVNATITQADFGATNGYLHVIDKVLGIPNQEMVEKLRTNPLLQTTYQLWMKERFDEKLNSSLEPFTFFAPSESAWRDLRFKNEAAYHNILHGSTGRILQRHFVVKQDHTIEQLSRDSKTHFNLEFRELEKTNTTEVRAVFPIASLNGYLKVTENKTMVTHKPGTAGDPTRKQEPETQYFVGWNKMHAHVIRANVKCTNGMIQIIDSVLIEDAEITIASAPNQFQFGPINFVFILFSTFRIVMFA